MSETLSARKRVYVQLCDVYGRARARRLDRFLLTAKCARPRDNPAKPRTVSSRVLDARTVRVDFA